MQVARSSDGAVSWESNVLIRLTDADAAVIPRADRQWLGSGAGDVVYASYRQARGLTWISRSDDGGKTFAPARLVFDPERVPVLSGPPVEDATGRLLQPLFAETPGRTVDGPDLLTLAVSEGGVSPFAFRDIARAEPLEYVGDYYPVLAVASDGAMHAAWSYGGPALTLEGGPRSAVVASSHDGGETWSMVPWSGDDDVAGSPWIVSTSTGEIELMWYARGQGDTSSLVFARGRSATGPGARTTIAPAVPHLYNGVPSYFPPFAHLPDGRTVAVWPDQGVWIAVESAVGATA